MIFLPWAGERDDELLGLGEQIVRVAAVADGDREHGRVARRDHGPSRGHDVDRSFAVNGDHEHDPLRVLVLHRFAERDWVHGWICLGWWGALRCELDA